MARPLPNDALTAIAAIVARFPDGAALTQIEAALTVTVPRRTLQYRLHALVDAGRLRMSGQRRSVRYHAIDTAVASITVDKEGGLPRSPEGQAVFDYIAVRCFCDGTFFNAGLGELGLRF